MGSSSASAPLRSYLLLYASMTLVGSYVALSKPLLAVLPVFTLALLRFAIGAAALLPWTRRAAQEPPLSRAEHGRLFLMSLFGNFLFSLCMLSGVERTSATAAGVILAALPAVVAALSWLLLRERLGPRAAAAIVLAVGGIALLHWARTVEQAPVSVTLLGNLLLVGAVLCEAMYVILARRLSGERRALRIAALINLWGLVLIAPLGIWQLRTVELRSLQAGDWMLLLFYSLSASVFSVVLWMRGARDVPAHRAGVFTVALPIAATLIGVLVLRENWTWLHAAALLCAAGGVIVISRDAREHTDTLEHRHGP